ncbi:hypothetical protein ACFL22_00610 [Patescibacteria group bacterium]
MSHGDMLGAPLSKVTGPVSSLLERLTGPDWKIWLTQFNKFLRKEPVVWQKTEFLELVDTVEVAGYSSLFNVKKEFGEAWKGMTSSNYINNLITDKIERDVEAGTLCVHKAIPDKHSKWSTGLSSIAKELGHQKEIAFWHIFYFLAQNRKSKYVFCFHDKDGVLCGISAHWEHGSLSLSECYVNSINEFDTECLIVSMCKEAG